MESALQMVRFHRYVHRLKITDLIIACIDWDTTVKVLDRLRQGVQARRKRVTSSI